jgi:hypothetical protein
MTKEQLIAYIENKIRYVALVHTQNATALAREQVIRDALDNIYTTLDMWEKEKTDKIKTVKTRN